MNFKDCLYGQMRILRGYPDLKCTDLPNDLDSVVTRQQIITWNNNTGMNPLYNHMRDITLMSYGEMLEKSWDMDSVWLDRITDGKKLTAAEYEAKVMEDYSNEFTLLCKRLSMWWLIGQCLNQPDVLDYDFVIVRQIDTLFNPHCNAEMLADEMARANTKVLGGKDIPAGIPVCYDLSKDMDRRHASSTMLTSHAFILNRDAVITLKDSFYQKALHEVDYYYIMLGSHNFLNGDPGGIMHRICIKQNVEPMSVREIFLRPEHCRGGDKGGKVDFSNIDRTGA